MSTAFKEFKITWQSYPYVYNPKRVVFVRAANEADAKTIAVKHVEQQGLDRSEFAVHSVTEEAPLPPGEVTHG